MSQAPPPPSVAFTLELRGTSPQFEVSAEWMGERAVQGLGDWAGDTTALKRELAVLEQGLFDSFTDPLSVAPARYRQRLFGQRLFEAVFAGEVGALYRRAIAAVAPIRRLRLELAIEDPWLAELPWELLYDPQPEEFLALTPHLSLVRRGREGLAPRRRLKTRLPLRVLVVISDVDDPQFDRIDVERERGQLEQTLAPLREEGLLELVWLQDGVWENLQAQLGRGPWQVVHFIGHGDFDAEVEQKGVIYLKDQDGLSVTVSADRLAQTLLGTQGLRLVVLNSCMGDKSHSGLDSTAQTLSRRGLAAVVAMRGVVSNPVASRFSEYFYRALAGGQGVDAAVQQARIQLNFMAPAPTLEWATPTLYLNADDTVLFDLQPKLLLRREVLLGALGLAVSGVGGLAWLQFRSDQRSLGPNRTLAGDGPFRAVASSPGRLLAGDGRGRVWLWSNRGDTPQALPAQPHQGAITAVALEPSRGLALTAAVDGVALWNLATSELLGLVPDQVGPRAVQFSPDARHWLTLTQTDLEVWQQGRRTPERLLRREGVRAAAWLGQDLVSQATDGTLALWGIGSADLRPLNRWQPLPQADLLLVGVEPSRRRAVLVHETTVAWCDLPPGDAPPQLQTLVEGDPVHLVALSETSRQLALLTDGHELLVWNLEPPTPTEYRRLRLDAPGAKALTLCWRDQHVAVAHDDARVRIWKLS